VNFQLEILWQEIRKRPSNSSQSYHFFFCYRWIDFHH